MSRPEGWKTWSKERQARWLTAGPLDWKCLKCGVMYPDHPNWDDQERFANIKFCSGCVEQMIRGQLAKAP